MNSVVVSLIYLRARSAREMFSPRVRELWDQWEVRFMAVLSLILQIILIFVGNRRKKSRRIRIRVVLWCAYLMADWVATVALGVILDNTIDGMGKPGPVSSDVEITAFWAPFLLLHLGGPDTITAYSLEDNELWLRHLLGLGVETGVALYIFLVAWIGSRICVLSIPILCAGIIKYGERTWALRSASNEQFRVSMLTPPDPGPNYAKFMQEYSLKQFEGYEVIAEEINEVRVSIDPPSDVNDFSNILDPKEKEDKLLGKAFEFLQVYKRLFVDLILGVDDREKSQSLFFKICTKDAYQLIDIELSFVYDMLYTKASLIHSLTGWILRIITCACTCSVLVFFTLAYHKHSNLDLFITYMLMCAAVLLEVYAILSRLSSDWTGLWLIQHKKLIDRFRKLIPHKKLIDSFRKLIPPSARKSSRWSNSITQFNALSFYLKDRSSIIQGIQKLLSLNKKIEYYQSIKYKDVSQELKALIFEHLKKKYSNGAADVKSIIYCRGSEALKQCTELEWSVKVDFDQSILIWHIATYLCYKKDHPKNSRGNGGQPKNSEGKEDHPKNSEGMEDQPKNSEGMEDQPKNSGGKEDHPKNSEVKKEDHPKRSSKDPEKEFSKMSKRLSQYMVYLLVMQPKMLPVGIGMIRFRDTQAEVERFFEEYKSTSDDKKKSKAWKMLLNVKSIAEAEVTRSTSDHKKNSKAIDKFKACKMLLNVNSSAVEPIKVKGDRSKSVLFEGCRLASQLQVLPEDKNRKWEMISNVWVEMLAYAASQCRGSDHAQQLRRGGELLSHVWLLMAHFGLTEQFQISQGHARVKLVVQ